jgi:hypothetical protein
VLGDSLTSKLQNEHQEIGWYRVNFKEKAIYMPKNVQIGNFHVHDKNKPFLNWFIFTDPDCSGVPNFLSNKLKYQKFQKISKIQNF